MIYDIAYSLNHETKIKANSWGEAESKLKDLLRVQGVNLKTCTLEIFDVNEIEEDE
jgi:hypothetical protein